MKRIQLVLGILVFGLLAVGSYVVVEAMMILGDDPYESRVRYQWALEYFGWVPGPVVNLVALAAIFTGLISSLGMFGSVFALMVTGYSRSNVVALDTSRLPGSDRS